MEAVGRQSARPAQTGKAPVDVALGRRFAAVWRAFRAAALEDDGRGQPPEWAFTAGVQLSAIARIEGQPDLLEALQRVQARLGPQAGLLLHPPQFLHLTVRMFGVGLSACQEGCDVRDYAGRLVSSREIDVALRQLLQGRPAFSVELRGVNAWPSAPFVQAFDAGMVTEIRAGIAAALPQLVDREYAGGFVPHLTLGYVCPGARLRDLAASIAPLRTLRVGEMHVRAIELVWGRGGTPHPELTAISRYVLT